jgi:hypothetical protein
MGGYTMSMQTDKSIVLPAQLIGQMILKIDYTIRMLHLIHQYTNPSDEYYECMLDSCGELNPLIKRAQQMGYKWNNVHTRR